MVRKGLAEQGAGIAHVYHTARRCGAELHALACHGEGGTAPAERGAARPKQSPASANEMSAGSCSQGIASPPWAARNDRRRAEGMPDGHRPCSWGIASPPWAARNERRRAERMPVTPHRAAAGRRSARSASAASGSTRSGGGCARPGLRGSGGVAHVGPIDHEWRGPVRPG